MKLVVTEKNDAAQQIARLLSESGRPKADKVYDILMQNGIEAIIDDNSGYFDLVEIETLSDMLRVIDNRHQDIPLLSVTALTTCGL